MEPGRTPFETEMLVRPDDIDMNQHVHASKYFDYVLAARYDQMARCYGLSWEEFDKLGLGWFAKVAHIEFKRPLRLGDCFVVRTWVERIEGTDVRVCFEMRRKQPGKRVCEGWCDFTMINRESGRAEPIPDWIAARYAV